MATKIYCPRCEWAPGALDRWVCEPGCRTVWNTFETRGRCPGCGKQWRITQCIQCMMRSLHEQWYHEDAERVAESDQRVEVLVGAGTS